MQINLKNRNPQLDVTTTQRWTRNAKTWGAVAVTSIIAAGCIAGLIMSCNRHIASAMDLTSGSKDIWISIGCGVGGVVSISFLPLIFVNAKDKHDLHKLLDKDFEGTKEDLLAAANRLSRNSGFGLDERYFVRMNLDRPVPQEDKDNWTSRFSGWSQYNLSPNEREMGYLLMQKIGTIWELRRGSWVEKQQQN